MEKESLVPKVRFKGFSDPWEQRKLNDVLVVHSGKDYKHGCKLIPETTFKRAYNE